MTESRICWTMLVIAAALVMLGPCGEEVVRGAEMTITGIVRAPDKDDKTLGDVLSGTSVAVKGEGDRLIGATTTNKDGTFAVKFEAEPITALVFSNSGAHAQLVGHLSHRDLKVPMVINMLLLDIDGPRSPDLVIEQMATYEMLGMILRKVSPAGKLKELPPEIANFSKLAAPLVLSLPGPDRPTGTEGRGFWDSMKDDRSREYILDKKVMLLRMYGMAGEADVLARIKQVASAPEFIPCTPTVEYIVCTPQPRRCRLLGWRR